MIENITEQDLEFYETIQNPVALTECLFSDLDNLGAFDEDFSEVRLGQYPLLSYEYLIDKNPHSSARANFKLKEGAGTLYCMGGRLFGKCEDENSLCLLADGTYSPFKNLVGTIQKVLGLNPENLKIEPTDAYFFDNGEKECFKINLKSGKSITITENHPLLTDLGWKECKDLKENNFIATPSYYPIEGNIEVDENIAKILGYLIGDGSCSGGQIGFTNINTELIEEFIYLASYFTCDIRKVGISYYVKNKGGVRIYKDGKPEKNNIHKLVEKYKINKLSKEKTLPNEIFLWKNKYIALLINRLFACDAYVSKDGNYIEYCSASKILVYQIHSLLLRFGIYSRITYKKIKLNDNFFDAWLLGISKDRDKFLKIIGIKSKEHKIRLNNNKHSPSLDIIPRSFINSIYNELEGFKKRFNLKAIRNYNNPTKDKLRYINSFIKNEKIQKWIDSDIMWDKIVSIEKVGVKKTVGVEVPKFNNYISNDIISHNSLFVEIVDMLLSMLLLGAEQVGFSSYDAIHIRGIIEKVIQALEYHPILQFLEAKVNRSPNYRIVLRNGYTLESVNMNLSSNTAGAAFYQKHFHRLYLEEASFETEEVYKARQDSISEDGCVVRAAGMCNFTKYSPIGRVFYDIDKAPWVLNLPQYINPKFDKRKYDRAIKEHQGEGSVSFRCFVKGEVVEEGVSVFDMLRIRPFYAQNKIVKSFEINKDNYINFENIIVVDKAPQTENLYICADIGESAPTEIVIISEINKKFYYNYNITLYNLTDKEQFKIFKWLGEILGATYIGLDTTEGTGRAIYRSLAEVFPVDNLCWCSFNEKIAVGIDRDEYGRALVKDGKIAYKEEFVSEWSIKHLKDLLYDGLRFELPLDYKLDAQLNSVIANTTTNRVIYECVSENGDHLLAAWRVFGITQWLNEFNSTSSIKRKRFYKGL